MLDDSDGVSEKPHCLCGSAVHWWAELGSYAAKQFQGAEFSEIGQFQFGCREVFIQSARELPRAVEQIRQASAYLVDLILIGRPEASWPLVYTAPLFKEGMYGH